MPNIQEITELSAPALEVFARLTETQLRSRLEPEKGIFIAESPKVIARALDAGCEPVSFLMERRHIGGQARGLLARCERVPVYTADESLLASLTGLPPDPRGAVRHAPPPAPRCRGAVQGCAPGGGSRKYCGRDQRRRDLPIGGGAQHGRRAGNPLLL